METIRIIKLLRGRAIKMMCSAIPCVGMVVSISCSSGKAQEGDNKVTQQDYQQETVVKFDADSAFFNIKNLMEFGPRVPNTEAHRRSGDWLVGKMKDYGWQVTEQKADIKAFDGTVLHARNIFSQLNPENKERLLLLAHWDCRPWTDADPDPARRSEAVAGANDGASGIGVLLEIARQLSLMNTKAGVDILFVDAEDWGSHDDEDSWALGTRYFAQNPPVEGYAPSGAILLDMVGSPDATFGQEYFSSHSNPALLQKVWNHASKLGYGNYFHNGFGGAVTDDHVELIKQGIPAIDIIDYRYSSDYQGFDPVWHTTADTIDNISPETLKAVGTTLMSVITEN